MFFFASLLSYTKPKNAYIYKRLILSYLLYSLARLESEAKHKPSI